MTSKEALERYYSNLMYGNGGFQTDEEELEGLNTIKQDLKRNEELEKENQDLRAFVEAYANARDELLIKNQKLEKTIEIIKIQISLENIQCENGYIYIINIGDISILINQQEYELLNEVLGNVK